MILETVVRSENCRQHKKKSRTFLRGEARRNEGADASREGVADHLQRSISSNMFILRRYERSGAVDKREIVFFRDMLFAAFFTRGKQGTTRPAEGADACRDGANGHFRRPTSSNILILR